ncbi:hypothetical protein DFP72DRAFT_854587 [Ephemerocybe angulata]|uniref:Uncharacterized protein n=1 Tax=Ephemerocybe angulata TaxID=980116 RepID=A0A8H6LY96_9AGAR|nr:hypothetical protein DFP72DRAFT_854587 [Tulosesus angulatus]
MLQRGQGDKIRCGAEEDETPFFSGLLNITAGTMKGAVMEWTTFHDWGTIKRPVSYEDALNLIERLANTDHNDRRSLKKATRPGYTTGEWTISRMGLSRYAISPPQKVPGRDPGPRLRSGYRFRRLPIPVQLAGESTCRVQRVSSGWRVSDTRGPGHQTFTKYAVFMLRSES